MKELTFDQLEMVSGGTDNYPPVIAALGAMAGDAYDSVMGALSSAWDAFIDAETMVGDGYKYQSEVLTSPEHIKFATDVTVAFGLYGISTVFPPSAPYCFVAGIGWIYYRCWQEGQGS